MRGLGLIAIVISLAGISWRLTEINDTLKAPIPCETTPHAEPGRSPA